MRTRRAKVCAVVPGEDDAEPDVSAADGEGHEPEPGGFEQVTLDQDQPTVAGRRRASLADVTPSPTPEPAPAPVATTDPRFEETVADPAKPKPPRRRRSPTISDEVSGVTSSEFTGAGGQTSLVASSRDFLRADDVNRIHTFAGGMNFVCLLGLYCVAALPGDPLATQVASIAFVVLWVGFAAIWWISRDIARFSPNAVGILGLLLSAASGPMAYYFGAFSAFPAVVVLAIYNYSLGSPLRYAFGTYVVAAIAQGALGACVITGALEDRGLMVPDDADTLTKIVAQVAVQVLYVIAFGVGRVSARRTRETVQSLERAVRQVAAREALLREARQELERAAGIGEAGRFTEQQLGSFELGVVIGRGGMGEIYAATHLETGEPAAVKLLQRAVLQTDADPIQRFEREARLVASLDSPHVVRVLEIGGALAPLPYLAMERLVGADLATRLRERRRLRSAEVAELVAQVAAGLVAAREAQIVHRDLKPQNLFRVDETKTWKILDFGVSKLAGDPGTLSGGHLIGTPAYMAPEQATGDGSIDHRADVYSLAVIAYRTLTGRPAFTGKDLPRLIHAVVHDFPPAPSELVDVPPEVDAVLRVGLAKDPEDRFARAEDFAKALDAALRGRLKPKLRAKATDLLEEQSWSAR